MFWFLRKKFQIPQNPGWIRDPIDIRDFRYEEIFGEPSAVSWQEIDPNPEPMFPIKNQDGSSSCVGNAVSKALGILEYYENGIYRELSARDIYTQRTTTGPGMIIREAMDIGVKKGCTLESLMPSQGLNEREMNKRLDANLFTEEVAKVSKAKAYGYSAKSFDTFAGLLEQKIPIVIGVSGSNEGWRVPGGWVRPPLPGETIWYHALVIAPENKKGKNYGLINGKKVLIVDNSWGWNFGVRGQAILTEEYLPNLHWNFFFQSLPDNWRDTEPNTFEKPKHKFEIDLYYGLKNDAEVIWLQKCLKWYGVFPKALPETGNYYSITKEAVESFQITENILKAGEPGFGQCGPKTREILNKIFA